MYRCRDTVLCAAGNKFQNNGDYGPVSGNNPGNNHVQSEEKNKIRIMKDYSYDKLDTIFHSRIRLAITSALINVEEMEFTTLRDIIKATDGNMNTHLKKMEEAGYISVKKEFINRKPVTFYSLTKPGIKKFKEYLQVLEGFIN